ncbi:M15 family metallopeptidase [Bacillus sp. FJAT-52991]|uniref:M15 family metallopeptidase n=1 Tax=Bacillus kandeliae TaxID=3129297 RepID=A0ABZ2NBR0_9BACI
MKKADLLEKAKKKLAGVHPYVAEKALKLVEMTCKENIAIIITQGLRTISEQNLLYEQGRSKPGNIVTNARGGHSYHNFGLAFDYCVCDVKGGKLIPNWTVDKRWKRVGALGQELGLEWGGNWRDFVDYPHFQYTFGLSLAQLRSGKKPPAHVKKNSKKYRVLTGTFKDPKEQQAAAERLRKATGWVVYAIEKKGLRLMTGTFSRREEAENAAERVRTEFKWTAGVQEEG